MTSRYPEVTLNSDMRRMYMNMVPFKGLGLLTTSSVPISSRGVSVDRSDKPYDLIGQVLDSKNSPFGCDYWRGRFMACCALFRGTLTPDKATSYVTAVQEKHWSSFASTFTQGIQTTYVAHPPHGLKTSASVVANTTAVRQPLGNLLKTFRAMFKQRVLLHYYLGEGLEEAEFRTAEHRLSALVTLYLKQHGKSKAHTGQDFGGSDEDD
ncbi:hypothetical protein AAG570_008611 [Ranatra chinensis]|uniref:Tubulin/FtsZ 2-layer sandwich domain-containing protein n=1 Tax=Ranatra chinensis TaxID=642074 RepID=A0ABD0ZCJ9_9HEMI